MRHLIIVEAGVRILAYALRSVVYRCTFHRMALPRTILRPFLHPKQHRHVDVWTDASGDSPLLDPAQQVLSGARRNEQQPHGDDDVAILIDAGRSDIIIRL